MWWTPLADQLVLEGGANEEALYPPSENDEDEDEDENEVPLDGDLIRLDDCLRGEWDLTAEIVAVVLWRSDDGFVTGSELTEGQLKDLEADYNLQGEES